MAKQYGFYVNVDRCVLCYACEVACKSANNVELGVKWRQVVQVWKGEYPNATFKSVSMACMHCADPACVAACPMGAISKREEDGAVVVDQTKCIGCHSCESACPYGAPHFGANGLMQKCDMCVDRRAEGRPPACATTCPAKALQFGALEDMPTLAGKAKAEQLAGDTGPSVFITVTN